MPKVVEKPAEKAAAAAAKKKKPEPATEQEEKREIIYPEPETAHLWGNKAITLTLAKELLGWETEAEYRVRACKEDPSLKPDQIKWYSDSDKKRPGNAVTFDFEDLNKEKIKCWNNNKNRELDLEYANQYSQEVLTLNWAGPSCMPGETVNGETIIISRTGRVESGQKRLVGLAFACQKWAKDRAKWGKNWPNEPVLDSLVFFGCSENPKVIRSLDNVCPRTLGDVLYTSQEFADLYDRREKSEVSRMLEKAIDFLWQRTGAEKVGGTKVYQTHAESMEFLHNHQRLKKCVRHIYEENKNRALSILKLSPGQCAGMMYLMATSGDDGDTYRNMDTPSEKKLKFEDWGKAALYWTDLVKDTPQAKIISTAIKQLIADEDGGRAIEKHSIIAKSWGYYVQGEKFAVKDLELEYAADKYGVQHLTEFPDFAGIDVGPKHAKESYEPSEEQIAAEKAQLRKEQADKLLAARQAKGVSQTVAEPGASKDGKPPAPKLKPQTRKDIEAANTAAAKKADEEKAHKDNGETVAAAPGRFTGKKPND